MDNITLDIPNSFKRAERKYELPNKLLLTGGPTNFSPRVISAMTNSTLTPICKEIYEMMDDIKEMLKYVFQTKNEVTLALQNSGTGGLEAALTNLVEPGEKIIIACGGIWGDRTVKNAQMLGMDVVRLETKLGEVFTFEELEEQIIKHKPVLLFITQGESSGGTNQPLEGLGDICHKHNCLLAVDAVVSLGGVPYFQDRWKIDVGVSATQKAIGAPAGIAFVTFSPRAVERMRSIKTYPPFVYNILELSRTWNCFGTNRKYHFTYNSHMLCATREALCEVVEEGLENRWRRHKQIAERFWCGMEKLGIKHIVPNPENRLWTVNLVYVPMGVKWPILLDYLEKKHKVIIGFGIGPTTDIGLRIGIMAYNATEEVVDYTLEVLEDAINYCRSEAGQLSHSVTIPKVELE